MDLIKLKSTMYMYISSCDYIVNLKMDAYIFQQEELDTQPDEVAVGPLRWGTTSTSAYGNWKTVK